MSWKKPCSFCEKESMLKNFAKIAKVINFCPFCGRKVHYGECLNCGKPFMSHRSDQRFCRKSCSETYRRRARR